MTISHRVIRAQSRQVAHGESRTEPEIDTAVTGACDSIGRKLIATQKRSAHRRIGPALPAPLPETRPHTRQQPLKSSNYALKPPHLRNANPNSRFPRKALNSRPKRKVTKVNKPLSLRLETPVPDLTPHFCLSTLLSAVRRLGAMGIANCAKLIRPADVCFPPKNPKPRPSPPRPSAPLAPVPPPRQAGSRPRPIPRP